MAGRERGFTLIELIVVILIVGILAAAALPRFMSATVDARIAKTQAIHAAVRSAAGLAKARCELDLGRGLTGAGQCGNASPKVTMDGVQVDMVNRYPDATATGIMAATQLDASINNADSIIIVAGPPFMIQVAGATTPAQCSVSYSAATATAPPTILLVTSGC